MTVPIALLFLLQGSHLLNPIKLWELLENITLIEGHESILGATARSDCGCATI